MSIEYAVTPELRQPETPIEMFAECDIDDALPFPGWQPSPDQIAQWCLQIRQDRGEVPEAVRCDAGQDSPVFSMGPPVDLFAPCGQLSPGFCNKS